MIKKFWRYTAMPSGKEYLKYILGQCEGLTSRCRMGEFLLYYKGKLVGGIYNNRFLVKPTRSAKALMPDAEMQPPYNGSKNMILVNVIDNKAFLKELFEGLYADLPDRKVKEKVSL